MSKIVVRLASEDVSAEPMVFDTETKMLTNEEGGEVSVQARNLACTLGMHAWLNGKCVNCGVKRP